MNGIGENRAVSALAVFVLSVVVLACSDDEQAAGTVTVTGSVVRDGYAITDYTVTAGDSELVVGGLADGDRLLLVPLDTTYTSGPATLRHVTTLDIAYAGGVPRSLAPRHRVAGATGGTAIMRPGSGTDALDQVLPDRSLRRRSTRAVERTLGSVENFFVIEDFDEIDKYGGITAPARLLYKGEHCYVYLTTNIAAVANAGAVATNAGTAFDTKIYDRVTSLFGHEWGVAPGDAEPGGIDGDPRVFILFQDVTKHPPGGYFSGRDEYLNSQYSTEIDRYSNEKEMFYVCQPAAYMTDWPNRNDVLAHEFQHMVEFNQVRRKAGGQNPLSFVNEGLSQVAEAWCGYGPLAARIAAIQACPRTSWLVWLMAGRENVDSYYAAYAMLSYMVRRFTTAFVATMLAAPPVSLDGINTALKNAGYAGDYPKIVLDMLTALWLDRDEFRFPAAGLYPGDTGIAMTGAAGDWGQSGLGDTTNARMLQGARTRFPAAYPATLDVDLYDYGSDMIEVASGDGGTFTFRFRGTKTSFRLRVVRLGSPAAATVPVIDGYGADWTARSGCVRRDDPAGDATYAGTVTGLACDPGADMTNVAAFCTNDVLYLAMRAAGPMHPTDATNNFMFRVGVAGGSGYQYNLYCHDSGFSVYAEPAHVPVDVPFAGVGYARRAVFELVLPLSVFGSSFDPAVRIQPLTYNRIGTNFVLDLGPELAVPRL